MRTTRYANLVAVLSVVLLAFCQPSSADDLAGAQSSKRIVETISAAMVGAADDASPKVRTLAVSFLAETESGLAMDVLRKCLDDKDASVRSEALRGIVKVAGPTDEVITTLIDHLSQPTTSQLAARLLRDTGDAAVPFLVETIQQESPATVQAVRSLGRLKLSHERAAEAVSVLTKKLGHDDEEVRLAAVTSLTSIMNHVEKSTANGKRIEVKYKSYAKAYIRKYDTDSDGTLSTDELAKIRRTPLRDLNDDGRVTADEATRIFASGE